ncbi:hypothetical protein Tco_1449191 [Tanacetum coccineum]
MRTRSSSNLVGSSSSNPTTINPKRRNHLLRACPHHGFTKLNQLDTFYNALNPADQDSLNSAAGGNLLERSTQDVLTIIENKSKVCNSRNKLIVSQVKSSDGNSSSSDIAKLTHAVNQQTSVVTTAMTAILKQFQETLPPSSVKAVEEICVKCGGAHPYYQCLAADGNTFPELRDNIQGYVSAATGNYNQGNSGYRPPGVVAIHKFMASLVYWWRGEGGYFLGLAREGCGIAQWPLVVGLVRLDKEGILHRIMYCSTVGGGLGRVGGGAVDGEVFGRLSFPSNEESFLKLDYITYLMIIAQKVVRPFWLCAQVPKPLADSYGPASPLNFDATLPDPVPAYTPIINYHHHQRKRMVSGNNYNRVDYDYYAKTSHPSAHRNMVSRAVLLKSGLTPLNTARPIYTAQPKPTVHSARSMPRAVNTARPYTTPVNVVRAKMVNAVKTSAYWVWRPTRPNGASLVFKRNNYIDAQGISKISKAVWVFLEYSYTGLRTIPTGERVFHVIITFLVLTTTVKTLDSEEVEIKATVDGHDKTITKASVRSSLQLADADGISNMSTTEIFEQLVLMGSLGIAKVSFVGLYGGIRCEVCRGVGQQSGEEREIVLVHFGG